MGRIEAWDELSLYGIWDELSLGTNCRLGRIVAQPKICNVESVSENMSKKFIEKVDKQLTELILKQNMNLKMRK